MLKREISDILHTRYQSESVYITLTGVEVAPDLRAARVFVSVIGDEERSRTSLRWLQDQSDEIRHYLSKRIVLKYLPHLRFNLDPSIERGVHLIELLDELEEPEEDEENR